MRKIRDALKNNLLPFFFLVFAGGLSALSRGPLPPEWKLGVGVAVMSLFLWLLLRNGSMGFPTASALTGEPVGFNPWLLVFLAILMVLLRFWKLTSLVAWPGPDESLCGLRAMQLCEKWEWRLFFFQQATPLVWASAAVFKLSHSGFLCLWLPSAAISVLTVPAAVLCARTCGTKSRGWILGCLFAFSYWPLFLGRTCQTGILLPGWECLGFYGLCAYGRAGEKAKGRWAALLGLWTGAGYFTFPSWVVVSAVMIIYFFYRGIYPRKRWGDLARFCLWFCGAVSPCLWGWWTGEYGAHVRTVALWTGGWDPGNFSPLLAGYLGSLFWESPGQSWFNPLLGACFFIGLAVLYRTRRRYFAGLILVMTLFLAPGVLSMNLEFFRIVQVLPLVLWTAALGLETILAVFPPGSRVLWLLFFLCVIGWMDFRHLVRPYQRAGESLPVFSGVDKSIERYRAYQILLRTQSESGPGLIFNEFCPDSSFDASLLLATYPFNAVENGSLNREGARWAAILTNADYQPFLSPRFPGAQWTFLDPDRPTDARVVLAVFPLYSGNRQAIGDWTQASVCFRDINRGMVEMQENHPPEQVLGGLFQHYPLVLKDPMLVSCFWERMSDFLYYYYGHPYEKTVYALEQALKGYPAAHLYFKLGSLLMRKGQYGEAKEALEKADRAPLNLCPVAEALALLEKMKKQDPSGR
jgi:tetratricopeptide (TPR) repeat protein